MNRSHHSRVSAFLVFTLATFALASAFVHNGSVHPPQTSDVGWVRAVSTGSASFDPLVQTPSPEYFEAAGAPIAAAVLSVVFEIDLERYVEFVSYPRTYGMDRWTMEIPDEEIRLRPHLRYGQSHIIWQAPEQTILVAPGLDEDRGTADDWTGRLPDGETDFAGDGGHVYTQTAVCRASWVIADAAALTHMASLRVRPVLSSTPLGTPYDVSVPHLAAPFSGTASGVLVDVHTTCRRKWQWRLEYVAAGDQVPSPVAPTIAVVLPGPQKGPDPAWDPAAYPPPTGRCSSCPVAPTDDGGTGSGVGWWWPDEREDDALGRPVRLVYRSRELWRSPTGGRGPVLPELPSRCTWSLAITPRGTARVETSWVARVPIGWPHLPTEDWLEASWLGDTPWWRIPEGQPFTLRDITASGRVSFEQWPTPHQNHVVFFPTYGPDQTTDEDDLVPVWELEPLWWTQRGFDGVFDGAGHSGRSWSLDDGATFPTIELSGEVPEAKLSMFVHTYPEWQISAYCTIDVGGFRDWDGELDVDGDGVDDTRAATWWRMRNDGVWWLNAPDVAVLELVVAFEYGP